MRSHRHSKTRRDPRRSRLSAAARSPWVVAASLVVCVLPAFAEPGGDSIREVRLHTYERSRPEVSGGLDVRIRNVRSDAGVGLVDVSLRNGTSFPLREVIVRCGAKERGREVAHGTLRVAPRAGDALASGEARVVVVNLGRGADTAGSVECTGRGIAHEALALR